MGKMNIDKDGALFDEETGEVLLSADKMEAVNITDMGLTSEFVRIAGDRAYWNAVAANKHRDYLFAKKHFEEVKAECWIRIREAGKKVKDGKGGEKPASLDDMKYMLCLEPEYKEAYEAMIMAEAEKEQAKGFAFAVGDKKDALQSLGARVRDEMKNPNPSTRETFDPDEDD